MTRLIQCLTALSLTWTTPAMALPKKAAKFVERVNTTVYQWPAQAPTVGLAVSHSQLQTLVKTVEANPDAKLSADDVASAIAWLQQPYVVRWSPGLGTFEHPVAPPPQLTDASTNQALQQASHGRQAIIDGMGLMLGIHRELAVQAASVQSYERLQDSWRFMTTANGQDATVSVDHRSRLPTRLGAGDGLSLVFSKWTKGPEKTQLVSQLLTVEEEGPELSFDIEWTEHDGVPVPTSLVVNEDVRVDFKVVD